MSVRYPEQIKDKFGGVDNLVRFIDGTVFGILRLKENVFQAIIYNGHKFIQTLKNMTVRASYDPMLRIARPMEGKRHNRTLYIRIDLDQSVSTILEISGRRFFIFGDSG